jgi:hypothetical protein
MHPEQIPGENDQADMKGTSMDDLPGTDGTDEDADVDVDAEQENKEADQLEDAEQKAAEKREREGGFR